jgi:hypothetical protein
VVGAALEGLPDLQREKVEGRCRWNDWAVNRVMAHLKTFSKWIHKLRPYPLGDPMVKIAMVTVRANLEIARALTPSERLKVSDAADLLLQASGHIFGVQFLLTDLTTGSISHFIK